MTRNAVEAIGLSKKFLLATERRTSLKERFVRGRSPEPQTFWALKDASFVVPKGSSLGIIGHNGSGKSTALKVLVGIYRPTSGTVKVNGSVSALLEVGAGFHPELTGRENIRLNATILGFTNREIDRLMDQIIDFADIGDHIDAPLKHYSSGMGVRLGFAVAVMVRPEILIVDEVIAVGDEEFQRKCYDYLYDLRRAGTSMIIVSHGLGQITELCDATVLLQHGEVRAWGPSRQVVRSYIEGVNQAEFAKAGRPVVGAGPDAPDSSSSGPPEMPGSSSWVRRGSGEIRVSRIDFLDDVGRRSESLISGAPLTIRLHYEATTNIEGIQVGLGFDDSAEQVVCTVYTQPEALLSLTKGTGAIEFRTKAFLPAAGSYRVRLAVTRKMHTVDSIDDGLMITIRESGDKMRGVFFQPGDWKVLTSDVDGTVRELGTT